MGLFKIYKAVLFDDKGEEADITKFKRKEGFFTKKKKSYTIDLKNASHFIKRGLLIDRVYYFYPLNNPSPLLLDKKCEPIMNADAFNSLLETKVIREINKLDKTGLSELLTPRNIIIGLIILGAVYYFATGGKIT